MVVVLGLVSLRDISRIKTVGERGYESRKARCRRNVPTVRLDPKNSRLYLGICLRSSARSVATIRPPVVDRPRGRPVPPPCRTADIRIARARVVTPVMCAVANGVYFKRRYPREKTSIYKRGIYGSFLRPAFSANFHRIGDWSPT